jgi:hypothetical protein
MTPTLRSHTLQSAAALRTGTRVEKINSTHGDSQVNGAHGTINTSHGTGGTPFRTTQTNAVEFPGLDATLPTTTAKHLPQIISASEY